jgi:hypothetical protein
MGYSFDAWMYHPQIDDLAGLADAFPDAKIVLNHCGGPVGINAYKHSEVFPGWKKSIDVLAKRPNVTVKLGGLGMRIRRIPLDAIKPGALAVDGSVLIEADLGFQIDNMEGIAVHRNDAGEIVLTLVSDDNFSPLQRTLLLQFVLVRE